MLARVVVLLLVALGGAAPAASGQPASGNGSGALAPGRLLPVVAEHHYTVTARIRPLLFFWISRDNVGEAVLRWRAGAEKQLGFELLIGSDPDRAPRHVNQWGYIAEEVRSDGAALLGVMKDSDDKTTHETTRFVVQYPRAGRLAGVPVHGVFRPRWWFEVEMTMDDPGGA